MIEIDMLERTLQAGDSIHPPNFLSLPLSLSGRCFSSSFLPVYVE